MSHVNRREVSHQNVLRQLHAPQGREGRRLRLGCAPPLGPGAPPARFHPFTRALTRRRRAAPSARAPRAGGLDSKTVCKRLVEAGIEVLSFSGDLGQPDETDIENVKKRMATCGVDTVIVDLKDDMAEGCFDAIQAQAKYDGGYWNTTGIGRYVTCRGLVRAMLEKKVTVLSHGATGRGNDQMRFERYTNVLAPQMRVYAPWRDALLLEEFPGRSEMAAWLATFKIEAFVGPKKKYSTDANLAGLSHEAEDLESVETPMTIVDPEMGVWPMDAPDKTEEVVVKFKEGRATHINGAPLTPVEAIKLANAIGGRNGVGIKHALENRIIGTKSRGVYEAPGMELLGAALVYLYQAVLDRRAQELFDHLSKHVGSQIYDGRFFDPSTRASMVAIQELTRPATGTVKVGCYKGNVFFLGLSDVAATLYNEADSSMEKSDGLNPVSSQGARGRQARPAARACRPRAPPQLLPATPTLTPQSLCRAPAVPRLPTAPCQALRRSSQWRPSRSRAPASSMPSPPRSAARSEAVCCSRGAGRAASMRITASRAAPGAPSAIIVLPRTVDQSRCHTRELALREVLSIQP